MTRIRESLVAAYWAFIAAYTGKVVSTCPLCGRRFVARSYGHFALLSGEVVCRKCGDAANVINQTEAKIAAELKAGVQSD